MLACVCAQLRVLVLQGDSYPAMIKAVDDATGTVSVTFHGWSAAHDEEITAGEVRTRISQRPIAQPETDHTRTYDKHKLGTWWKVHGDDGQYSVAVVHTIDKTAARITVRYETGATEKIPADEVRTRFSQRQVAAPKQSAPPQPQPSAEAPRAHAQSLPGGDAVGDAPPAGGDGTPRLPRLQSVVAGVDTPETAALKAEIARKKKELLRIQSAQLDAGIADATAAATAAASRAPPSSEPLQVVEQPASAVGSLVPAMAEALPPAAMSTVSNYVPILPESVRPIDSLLQR